MKNFIKKSSPRIIAGKSMIAVAILITVALTVTLHVRDMTSLFAAATSSIRETPVIAFFVTNSTDTLHVGDSAIIDININAHVPINAIGMTIKLPEDKFDVISISKEKSFLDLWTEDTVIREDAGEIHFSGGTLRRGGLTGIGTALTLILRAKKIGKAELRFLELDAFAHDGLGDVVESEKRAITYTITEPLPSIDTSAATSDNITSALSADFNNTGTVSLIDLSILTIHMIGPYDARYDLNHDGSVNIGDMSVLFAQMQMRH